MTEWWAKLNVTCPLCGAETTLAGTTYAPGYDLPPFIMDVGGRDVLATEHISPRMTSIELACLCSVPTSEWLLNFPAPGVMPFFVKASA